MDAKQVARGASTTLGAVAAAAAARRAWRSPAAYLARMSGTSISAPDAVGWVTDFLNAAYYARRPELRDVEDLRIAFTILTTRWYQLGPPRNRLLAYGLDGRDYLRAAGTWDDMPVTLEQAYRTQGRKAQQAFWGDDRPESSMLEQIALRAARP